MFQRTLVLNEIQFKMNLRIVLLLTCRRNQALKAGMCSMRLGSFTTSEKLELRTSGLKLLHNVCFNCSYYLWALCNLERCYSPVFSLPTEPIVRNGRPPSAHSVHSFLHQYTGSFKKPPLRRPQSVMGGGLGSLMALPRNGSRLGETVFGFKVFPFIEDPGRQLPCLFF